MYDFDELAQTKVREENLLVDLVPLLGDMIKVDIKYATTDNFSGQSVYDEARAFMAKPAAESLLGVAERLKEVRGQRSARIMSSYGSSLDQSEEIHDIQLAWTMCVLLCWI